MPGITLTVFVGNDPEVVSVVEGGEMPMGIVASDESCAPFESSPILDDELVVVVGPTYPWAQQQISFLRRSLQRAVHLQGEGIGD
jgi:DNA-binding transcriptional LysR family regulator